MNILSVAEKPSVAKELAAIISKHNPDTIKRAGFSPYNPIYEINNCQFKNQTNAYMKMTSVTGHMMEINFDPAYKNWSGCQPVQLFDAPIIKDVKKENLNIKKTLQAEAKKCNVLLLWLDCDLEGENIAYEVITVCLEANRNLDVYRARFSALIERDIYRTLRVPDRPNANMNDAVEARQEIDLRIGAAFTRFQSLRLQKKFDLIGNSVISFGPCQFPTLGFVVERNTKINQFRPENFWYISCDYEFNNPENPNGSKLSCNFNWDRNRLYDRYVCMVLYDSCIEDQTALATVVRCQEKPTSKYRPVPMNTIEFQIRASRLLHLSSDRAMEVAEKLYQRGILSYPRTETNYFQEGTELITLISDHRNHPDWGEFATGLVDHNKFQWPKAGGKDDQAHPPIHPTKSILLNELTNDEERKVYDLVTRHFLACCSTDAKGSQTKLHIQIPVDGESFHTTGLMIIERNWLDVYSQYEKWYSNKIPLFKVGDTFKLKSILMYEGKTTPPEPISESELISLMDKNGIGTDATIATHISTIQAREYAKKNHKNQFEPTKLGLALVEGYNSMGYQLNKPQLRAVIESDCQRIAKGEARKEDILQKCINNMKECFIVCNREAHKLDTAMEKYFTNKGESGLDNYDVIQARLSNCGICKHSMELRIETNDINNNSRTRFLFCLQCKKSHIIPNRGEIIAHEHCCAICHFQVLIVRNTETNKDHTICPYCFNNPPLAPIGIEGVSEFRCFSCAKEDCVLALRTLGSEVDISDCPAIGCISGKMRLKKTPKGYVISCSNSTTCKSYTWWVPKVIKSIQPLVDNYCNNCLMQRNVMVCKLKVKLQMELAPLGMEPECILCPRCDPFWEQTGNNHLQIRHIVQMQPPQIPVVEVAAYPRDTTTANEGDLVTRVSSNHHMNMNNNQMNTNVNNNNNNNNNNSSNHVTGQQSMLNYFTGSKPIIQSEINQLGNTSSNITSTRINNNNYNNNNIDVTNDYQAALAGINNNKNMKQKSTNTSKQITNKPSYPNTNSYNNNINNNNNNNNNTLLPYCKCGIVSVLRIVSKEGENKGKTFFACSKPMNEGCGFFAWQDANNNNNNNNNNANYNNTSYNSNSSYNNSSYNNSYQNNNRSNNNSYTRNNNNLMHNEDNPVCKCNEISICNITKKEGANFGRSFYVCSKRREDTTRCDFFKWIDSENNTNITTISNNNTCFNNNTSNNRNNNNSN